MSKRANRRTVVTAASCAMLGVAAVGGTLAYLTDTEQADNILTVGKVKLDLEEPNFPGNEDPKVKDQTPNQVTRKDPQIENTGNENMITYMQVSVPTKLLTEVTTDPQTGFSVKGEKKVQPLFYLKDVAGLDDGPNGKKYEHADSMHIAGDGNTYKWVLLNDNYVDAQGNHVDEPVDGGSRVIFVGYNQTVAPGAKTDTLFDVVQFKNFIEEEIPAGEIEHINIKAYGIQDKDLNLADGSDFKARDDNGNPIVMTDTQLDDVWKLYWGQSGDKVSPEADTTSNKDLKGNDYGDSQNPITDSEGNPVVATFLDENGNTVQASSLQDAVDRANGNTIVLQNDLTLDGFKAKSGQNVDLDLNGHELTILEPVGSRGTETNGMQLLKGSTVHISNGTILPGEKAKIMIQNYSDLTLEDVIVDGSGSSLVDYVLSNNFGNVTITGDTQLIAPDDKAAFDLWYGMARDGSYDDGVSVTFDDGFTGYVKGRVEYDKAGRVTDTNWTDKAALRINGDGKFDITFTNSNRGAVQDGANIEISGGNFSTDVAKYLAAGASQTAESGGRYVVE